MSVADVAIILGSGLLPNGELSNDSKCRVDKGVILFREGRAKNLLMCGGFMQRRLSFSLADAMKNYAVSLGVPAEKIYTESESLETLGNALHSKRICKANGWGNLLLVTSRFHMKRAFYFFELVFGPGFNIAPIDVLPSLPRKEEKENVRIENALLIPARVLLLGVEPGDDAEIIKRLRKKSKYRDFMLRLRRKFAGQSF